MLQEDIETEEIKNIIKSYDNSQGDYMFIVGKKKAGNNSHNPSTAS